MKTNKEIQILLSAIKFSLLQKIDNEHINAELYNWEAISSLSNYHCINPILSNYFAYTKSDSKFIKWLQDQARENAVSNLISSKEYNAVVDLLEKNEIEFLTYKGHLFLAELYNGKQLREIGDLDILIKPAFAKKTLEVLLKNDYNFNDISKDCNLNTDQLVEQIPNTTGMNETTLVKKLNLTKSYIDFHWGFHYSFLPYEIDLNWLFSNKKKTKINNLESRCPSNEALFTMLIIHHGGRDTWMKLKYMADLLGFMENLGDKIDWQKMIEKLAEMKLKRPALVGLFLLQEYFDYDLPEIIKQSFAKNNINTKLTEPIIDYWENCYNILSLKGRLKYERILWSIQDEGFSRWKYLKEMFKMYSVPNPIESPRLITFPNNFYILNGISKIITYLYKRGFGKVVR